MRALVKKSWLKPGFIGNFAGAIVSMRATSALACESVTPGFNLATPWQQKLIRRMSARFIRKGTSSEKGRSMN